MKKHYKKMEQVSLDTYSTIQNLPHSSDAVKCFLMLWKSFIKKILNYLVFGAMMQSQR